MEESILTSSHLIRPNHPILTRILPKEFKFNGVRVTNGSKMNFIVRDSLIHLQDTEQPPLILHTFNPIPTKESKKLEKQQQIPITSTPTLATTTNNATSLPIPTPSIPSIPTNALSKAKSNPIIKESKNSTNSLAKLISLTEIIKRSYLPPFTSLKASKLSDLKGKGKEIVGENEEEEVGEVMEGIESLPTTTTNKSEGKEKHKRSRKKSRTGLHQYNMIGALEELGILNEDDEEDDEEEEEEIDESLEQARQDDIVKEWLEGGAKASRRPRRKHTPYMIVVLSTKPLPELMRSKKFTHQAPLPLSQNLKAKPTIQQKSTTTTTKVEKRKADGEGEKDKDSESELLNDVLEKPRKKRKRSKKKVKIVGGEEKKKGKKDDMEVLEIIGGGMDVEDEVVA